jgi:Zn-finger nucleic acid-binding protein
MNCLSCHGAMGKVHGQSHHWCCSCDRYEFPTELSEGQVPITSGGESTGFSCPKCEVSLEVGTITDSVQVCFCNNCRGFVTSSQSLGQVIWQMRVAYQGADDRPLPIDPQELEIYDACPACRETMESHPYYGPGNIVLNTCNPCQLAWLDHGELAKIIRAPGPRGDR